MDNDSKKRPKGKESKQTKRYADTSTGNSTQKRQSTTNKIEKEKLCIRKIYFIVKYRQKIIRKSKYTPIIWCK